MMSVPFKRMAWKETRELLPLWLSVTVGAILVQLVIGKLGYYDVGSSYYIASVGLWLTGIYALAAAGSMFSGENENQTLDLLRRFPSSSGFMVRCKLFVGFTSTLLMLAILIPVTWAILVLCGKLNDVLIDAPVYLLSGLLWLQFLLWGALTSMLSRRVIWGIVWGAILAGVGNIVFPWNLLALPFVLWGIFHAGKSWYLGQPAVRIALPQLSLPRPFILISISRIIDETASPQARMRGRLQWLEWRRAKPLLLLILLNSVIHAFSALLLVLFTQSQAGWVYEARTWLFSLPITAWPLIAMIAGVLTYSGDQTAQQYRFLSERAVPAGRIFWNKLAVWFGLGVVLPGLMGSPILWLNRTPHTGLPQPNNLNQILIMAAAFLSMPFLVGQLSGLLIRSGIVAFVAALFATCGIFLWFAILTTLKVPLWLSFLPVPVILFVATRLRMGDWLLERNAFRHWAKFAAQLGLPLAITVGAVPFYRAYQIPLIAEPVFQRTPDQYRSGGPADQELAARLLWERSQFKEPTQPQATRNPAQLAGMPAYPTQLMTTDPRWDAYSPWDRVPNPSVTNWENLAGYYKDWVTTNAGWLFANEYPKPGFSPFYAPLAGDLAALHHLAGAKLEAEGDLKGAFQQHLMGVKIGAITWRQFTPDAATYAANISTMAHAADDQLAYAMQWIAHWGQHPKQTKEMLTAAIQELSREFERYPTPTQTAEILAYTLKTTETERKKDLGIAGEVFTYPASEQIRTERLLRQFIHYRLQEARTLEAAARTGLEPAPDVHQDWEQSATHVDHARTLLLANESLPYDRIIYEQFEMYGYWRSRITAQRMLLTLLRLRAWQVEHGKQPGTLHDLVSAGLASTIPQDAWNWKPLEYYPEGLPASLKYRPMSVRNGGRILDAPEISLPAKTPFLFASPQRKIVKELHAPKGFEIEPYQRHSYTTWDEYSMTSFQIYAIPVR